MCNVRSTRVQQHHLGLETLLKHTKTKNFEIRLGEVGFVDVQVFRVTGPKYWSCECGRSGGSWNTRKSVEWKGIILLLKTFVDTS